MQTSNAIETPENTVGNLPVIDVNNSTNEIRFIQFFPLYPLYVELNVVTNTHIKDVFV